MNSSGAQRRYDSIEHQRQSQIDKFTQSPTDQIASMMKINRGSYQAIEKVNKKSSIPAYNHYVSSKDNQRKTNIDNSVNLGNFNIMNSNSSVQSNMGKN